MFVGSESAMRRRTVLPKSGRAACRARVHTRVATESRRACVGAADPLPPQPATASQHSGTTSTRGLPHNRPTPTVSRRTRRPTAHRSMPWITTKMLYDGNAAMRRSDSATTVRFSAPAVRRWVLLLALAAGLAGCGSGSSPPGPYDVASNYLNQIAEGNYASACGLLDSGTREALIRKAGPRTSCSRLFVRCLPSQATKISRDQAQLLYATIQVTTHRKKAQATVAGTAVARAIRRVTLAKERGTWKLTSYGVALQRCPLKQHRPRAGRSSARAAVG